MSLDSNSMTTANPWLPMSYYFCLNPNCSRLRPSDEVMDWWVLRVTLPWFLFSCILNLVEFRWRSCSTTFLWPLTRWLTLARSTLWGFLAFPWRFSRWVTLAGSTVWGFLAFPWWFRVAWRSTRTSTFGVFFYELSNLVLDRRRCLVHFLGYAFRSSSGLAFLGVTSAGRSIVLRQAFDL